MKKKLVVMALSLLAVVLWVPSIAFAEGPPTKISTIAQLKAIENDPSGDYILTDDIDLSGEDWQPLCVDGFEGTFDGDGHKITGLTVTDFDESAGLFSCTYGATIKNVSIENASVNNSNDLCEAALLVGWCIESTIENCSVSGVATASPYCAGGIAGSIEESSISNCIAKVELSSGTALGGIAAMAYSNNVITNCYVETKNITPGSEYPFVGAVVGEVDGQPTFTSVRYLMDEGMVPFAVGYGADPADAIGLSSAQKKDPASFPGYDPLVWSFGENGPSLKVFEGSVLPPADPPTNLRMVDGVAQWDPSANAVGYVLSLHIPTDTAADDYVAEEQYSGTALLFDMTDRMREVAKDFFDSMGALDGRGRVSLYFSVVPKGDGVAYRDGDVQLSEKFHFYFAKSFDDDELEVRLPVGTSFADADLPATIKVKATGYAAVVTQWLDTSVVWDESAFDSSRVGTIEVPAASYTLPFNVVEKNGFSDVPTLRVTFYEEAAETPTLIVDPLDIAFGKLDEGKTMQRTIVISGSDLQGDIAYELTGDTEVFTVSPSEVWDAVEGGELVVDFSLPKAQTPTSGTETEGERTLLANPGSAEEEKYEAQLTISSPGAKTVVVKMTGSGAVGSEGDDPDIIGPNVEDPYRPGGTEGDTTKKVTTRTGDALHPEALLLLAAVSLVVLTACGRMRLKGRDLS